MITNFWVKISFYVLYSSKDGDTALHITANKLECMNVLLAAGADINIQDEVSIIIIHNLSCYWN